MIINKPKFWDHNVSFFSLILLPFTLFFLLAIELRRFLIRPSQFNIPIICVGNIYVGGTGKTPTAIFLAKELLKLRKNPVIIRKFYKSHSDEHNLIKENFDRLIICKNRKDGINEAIKKNYDVVILDDGFQDYAIKKNINIICFNQNQKIGNGLLMPSGPLREGLRSLQSANIIIINGEKNDEFEKKILDINKNLKIYYSNYRPFEFENLKSKKIFAIAGIGNPKNFFKLIENEGLRIEKQFYFPDHYKFKKNELEKIVQESNEKNCQILMTEKDYFKVKHFNLKEIRYLKVLLEIKNRENLIEYIRKYV